MRWILPWTEKKIKRKNANENIVLVETQNFKSLETLTKEKKSEDAEFEQQRKAIIAEALQAKEEGKSINFGGQKQVRGCQCHLSLPEFVCIILWGLLVHVIMIFAFCAKIYRSIYQVFVNFKSVY